MRLGRGAPERYPKDMSLSQWVRRRGFDAGASAEAA